MVLGIISMSSLMAVVVPSMLADGDETVEAWIAGSFDANLLFTALLVEVATGEIYRWFIQKNVTIKLPGAVPPAMSAQFTALIPGFVTLILFTVVRLLFAITPWGGFPAFVSDVISRPLRSVGTSYVGTLLACLMEHLLWSFGLHGSSVIIFPIFEPLWIVNMSENITEGARNIVTFTFYENGVWIGGSGATLAVVLYMMFFAKSELLKSIGRIGILPGLFNINEPVTFGLPIVLNPVLMVPYILAPHRRYDRPVCGHSRRALPAVQQHGPLDHTSSDLRLLDHGKLYGRRRAALWTCSCHGGLAALHPSLRQEVLP